MSASEASVVRVLWQSPTPNANGRYWRILSTGHVERMPRGWSPEKPKRRRAADSQKEPS